MFRRLSLVLPAMLAFGCLPTSPSGYSPELQKPPMEDLARQVPVGTQVRVWTWADRVSGTVVAFPSENTLQVRRNGLIGPWESRYRKVFWNEMQHVAVADGRMGVEGMVPGVVGGVLAAAALAVISTAASLCYFDGGTCGPTFGHAMAVYAVITVPLGAIMGARRIKWSAIF